MVLDQELLNDGLCYQYFLEIVYLLFSFLPNIIIIHFSKKKEKIIMKLKEYTFSKELINTSECIFLGVEDIGVREGVGELTNLVGDINSI